MRTLDKGKTRFYLPGAAMHCRWFSEGLPVHPSSCTGCASLQLRTAKHWCTLSGFPGVSSMQARRWPSDDGFVHCFHRRPNLRFQGGRVGSDPNLYHARAFARLCIVRCPLPMIISSLVIVSAGDLRAVRRVPVPGGRAAMFQHPSAFISSFIIISSFHHCSSLSVDVAMRPA